MKELKDVSERRVIVSEERLIARVHELGEQISRDYRGREVDVVCLINGGSTFCADLVRQIDVPIRQHYLGFSSYHRGNATGEVRLTLDVIEPLHQRHVLIVEGVVISGRTPSYIKQLLSLRKPASLALCALGIKPKSINVDLQIEYHAFELGPEFVVGYGVGEGPERTLPMLVEAGA